MSTSVGAGILSRMASFAAAQENNKETSTVSLAEVVAKTEDSKTSKTSEKSKEKVDKKKKQETEKVKKDKNKKENTKKKTKTKKDEDEDKDNNSEEEEEEQKPKPQRKAPGHLVLKCDCGRICIYPIYGNEKVSVKGPCHDCSFRKFVEVDDNVDQNKMYYLSTLDKKKGTKRKRDPKPSTLTEDSKKLYKERLSKLSDDEWKKLDRKYIGFLKSGKPEEQYDIIKALALEKKVQVFELISCKKSDFEKLKKEKNIQDQDIVFIDKRSPFKTVAEVAKQSNVFQLIPEDEGKTPSKKRQPSTVKSDATKAGPGVRRKSDDSGQPAKKKAKKEPKKEESESDESEEETVEDDDS